MKQPIPIFGKKQKPGFTLIEILLALLVVTIGVVTMAGLLGSSLDAGDKASKDLHVVSFADMVLNHCHAEDWENLMPGTLTLKDYAGNSTTLTTGTTDHFSSEAVGKDGRSIERFTVSYQLNIQKSGRVKTVTLRVWPGYDINGTPRIFHTEIYDWKKSE
ncbi:prepilin-type N-terminal cleavage/methylation domain-containing protein [Pontiellaceae bacterium B1224]|nr:prepilin-type N-terminal cleavage/methylation domain-containing protein [Pontiellaceae bacterium B1224]